MRKTLHFCKKKKKLTIYSFSSNVIILGQRLWRPRCLQLTTSRCLKVIGNPIRMIGIRIGIPTFGCLISLCSNWLRQRRVYLVLKVGSTGWDWRVLTSGCCTSPSRTIWGRIESRPRRVTRICTMTPRTIRRVWRRILLLRQNNLWIDCGRDRVRKVGVKRASATLRICMNDRVILRVVYGNLVGHGGHFLTSWRRGAIIVRCTPWSNSTCSQICRRRGGSCRCCHLLRCLLLLLLQEGVLNFAHRLHHLLIEGHLLFEFTFQVNDAKFELSHIISSWRHCCLLLRRLDVV